MTYYNRSVWWEEVDTALYELINKHVKYRVKGEHISVEPRVYPYNPNRKDGRLNYPTILIRHLSEVFDQERYEEQIQTIEVRPEAQEVILEESAKPFTLKVQLDFLANDIEHLNDMTRTWKVATHRRHLLNVVDMSGEARQCMMFISKPTPIHHVIDGEENILKVSVTLDVKVELDEGEQIIKNIVTLDPSISFSH